VAELQAQPFWREEVGYYKDVESREEAHFAIQKRWDEGRK
jgi:hypothetical protein